MPLISLRTQCNAQPLAVYRSLLYLNSLLQLEDEIGIGKTLIQY